MNQDLLYMRRCLDLAYLSRGYTAPNPMVGALLVYEGRVIGAGRHEHYGQAHAEVNCFKSVAEQDKHLIPLSTMYVSLEPCAHYGKTPPCALRIISEGVRKVVICNPDPFAQVNGRGIQLLEEQGIEVICNVLGPEGLWLNRRFFTFHSLQRPYIILKWAQTRQGIFAPVSRSRLQLSNQYSQQLSHRWRTEESAILVGKRTALNDNPRLQARFWQGPQPLRIAIDREASLPSEHRLLDGSSLTWIITGTKDATQGNTVWKQLPTDQSLLSALMQALYQAGRLSLIVEGGIHVLEQFIQAGLWDEARIFSTADQAIEGLTAPLLPAGKKILEVPLDTDCLDIFLNPASTIDYPPGMDL